MLAQLGSNGLIAATTTPTPPRTFPERVRKHHSLRTHPTPRTESQPRTAVQLKACDCGHSDWRQDVDAVTQPLGLCKRKNEENVRSEFSTESTSALFLRCKNLDRKGLSRVQPHLSQLYGCIRHQPKLSASGSGRSRSSHTRLPAADTALRY